MKLSDFNGKTVETMEDDGCDLRVKFTDGVVLVIDNYELSGPAYIEVQREVTELRTFKEDLEKPKRKK